MPLLWLAPALIALVGLLAVAAAAARANDEVKGLRRDVGRFSELRPALVELRHSTQELRHTAQSLRDR